MYFMNKQDLLKISQDIENEYDVASKELNTIQKEQDRILKEYETRLTNYQIEQLRKNLGAQ